MSGGGQGRNRRSPAEWITFALALVVLGVVAGLVVAEIPQSSAPASPVAEVRAVERRGDRHVVIVEVGNEGERTAQDVQIEASLAVDGDESSGDQVVDFLSGGEEEELEFVFDDDPSAGELVVRVTGYSVP